MPILQIDQEIDNRWIVRRFLGISALGEKYIAFDQTREQIIAIKLLSEDILLDAGGISDMRFVLNEFTHLSVPGIARVFDYGLIQEGLYLTMEYVEGEPYMNWLASQEPTEPELHQFFGKLAKNLHLASDAGAHLGLKPNNLFVSSSGEPIITDFGLNRLVSPQKLRAATTLTGDRRFLPPEFFESDDVQPAAADAFALGSLWLNALSKNEKKPHKPSRKTQRWLTTLTHSSPPLRSTNFLALAQDLTGKSPETTFLKHRPQFDSPKRMYLAFFIAALLLTGFWMTQWMSENNTKKASNSSHAIGLAEQIQSAELDRMELIKAAHEIPPFFTPIITLLSDPILLDTARRLNASLSDDTQDWIRAEQDIRRYQIKLTAIEDLLTAARPILSWLEIVDALSVGPLPIQEEKNSTWKQTYEDIHRLLKRGELNEAVTRSLRLRIDLEESLKLHWQHALETAQSAQQAWISLLEEHGLRLVEPGEDLSGTLKDLKENVQLNHLPDDIPKLAHIQKRWESWTQELRSVPPKEPSHFVNSLAMRFVRVDDLWVSIWETRNLDFARYILESGADRRYLWRERAALSGPTHPVVNITQLDATHFCDWLTQFERLQGVIRTNAFYRLPKDLEWSRFAGLTGEVGDSPDMRGGAALDHVPWWPVNLPEKQRGNYYTWPNDIMPDPLPEPYDHYATTAPVGSFLPNPSGLFDLGGNVWEWTMSPYRKEADLSNYLVSFAIRGAGWYTSADFEMKTSFRLPNLVDMETIGFRIVLDNAIKNDE